MASLRVDRSLESQRGIFKKTFGLAVWAASYTEAWLKLPRFDMWAVVRMQRGKAW